MVSIVIDGLDFHDRLGPQNYDLVTRALRWGGPAAIDNILKDVNLNGTLVADVGIGTGALSDMFRRRGVNEIIGVDGAPDFLTNVMLNGKADRIALADLKHDQIPLTTESMNLVTASGVLPYLDDPSNAINEMTRITKMDGYIAVNFHPSQNPMQTSMEKISASALFKRSAVPTVYVLYHHAVPEITGRFALAGADFVRAVTTSQGVMRATDESWLPLTTYLFQKKMETPKPFKFTPGPDNMQFKP